MTTTTRLTEVLAELELQGHEMSGEIQSREQLFDELHQAHEMSGVIQSREQLFDELHQAQSFMRQYPRDHGTPVSRIRLLLTELFADPSFSVAAEFNPRLAVIAGSIVELLKTISHAEREHSSATPLKKKTQRSLAGIGQAFREFEAAHEWAATVRRDLSPGNIFISSHSQPTIVDFGLHNDPSSSKAFISPPELKEFAEFRHRLERLLGLANEPNAFESPTTLNTTESSFDFDLFMPLLQAALDYVKTLNQTIEKRTLAVAESANLLLAQMELHSAMLATQELNQHIEALEKRLAKDRENLEHRLGEGM
ncbi:MAG TPA: hypothetical protein PKA58_13960 [Polyangium sp.]|nr:hypothetical protein [Polyangium sp.]